jgi:hypothetical protein
MEIKHIYRVQTPVNVVIGPFVSRDSVTTSSNKTEYNVVAEVYKDIERVITTSSIAS